VKTEKYSICRLTAWTQAEHQRLLVHAISVLAIEELCRTLQHLRRRTHLPSPYDDAIAETHGSLSSFFFCERMALSLISITAGGAYF
jgi:hypothetical protein